MQYADFREKSGYVDALYPGYREIPGIDGTWARMQMRVAEETGDPDVLDDLANFEHPAVRAMVAGNPGASGATLDRLANDEDPSVVVKAAQGLFLSEATHTRLLNDERAWVRKAAMLNRLRYKLTGVQALSTLRAEMAYLSTYAGDDSQGLVSREVSRKLARQCAYRMLMSDEDGVGINTVLSERDMDTARAMLDPESELAPVKGRPAALEHRPSLDRGKPDLQRGLARKEQLVAMLAMSGEPRDRLTAAAKSISTQQLKALQKDPDPEVRQMAAENMRNTVGSPGKRFLKGVGGFLNFGGPEVLKQ